MWFKPWTWLPVVVSSSTLTEAEWDDEQYELMIAFALYENDVHEACGHLLSESTALAADKDNPNGEYYYEAEIPIRCHACTAAAKMQKAYGGDDFDSARLFPVKKVYREPK